MGGGPPLACRARMKVACRASMNVQKAIQARRAVRAYTPEVIDTATTHPLLNGDPALQPAAGRSEFQRLL